MLQNNVKHLRMKRGISQTDLAERLKITISHMNKIENMKKPLTSKLASRIVEILNVSWDDIFLSCDCSNRPKEDEYENKAE